MILNHINHKMPIYKDCTVGEMLFVGSTFFTISAILLSITTKLLIGYAAIGFAVSFLLLVPATRISLGQLQKIKYGKPYGYYQHLMIKKLIDLGFIKNLYITQQCKWSVRRIV